VEQKPVFFLVSKDCLMGQEEVEKAMLFALVEIKSS
jgi:hypothetical protein